MATSARSQRYTHRRWSSFSAARLRRRRVAYLRLSRLALAAGDHPRFKQAIALVTYCDRYLAERPIPTRQELSWGPPVPTFGHARQDPFEDRADRFEVVAVECVDYAPSCETVSL